MPQSGAMSSNLCMWVASYHLCDDNQHKKSIDVNSREFCPIGHAFLGVSSNFEILKREISS